MQMERQLRAGGGLMTLEEPRQGYFLGKIVKKVKRAVRNAGGGDIDKGAEVMQNMMDNLEAGGMISEESQGMNPAQEMFDQSQMLEGRLA